MKTRCGKFGWQAEAPAPRWPQWGRRFRLPTGVFNGAGTPQTGLLLVRLKHGLQLPVRALLVVRLQAFQALRTGISRTRTSVVWRNARSSRLACCVVGIAFQNGAKVTRLRASKSPFFHSA